MKMFRSCLAALALVGLAAPAAAQAPCRGGPDRWVAANDRECLVLRAFGPARAGTLIVVLHGDLSDGSAATYHVGWAQAVSTAVPAAAVIALVRPGYPDAQDNRSAGTHHGRRDHYDAANMDLVAGAIRALKARTGATRVVGVGHSGGAATIANILGHAPGTVDAAVLFACNCDLVSFRAGRTPFTRSLDPLQLADRVPQAARVIALTGMQDTVAPAALARTYVNRLRARGINAEFRPLNGIGHNYNEAAWNSGLREAVIAVAAGR